MKVFTDDQGFVKFVDGIPSPADARMGGLAFSSDGAVFTSTTPQFGDTYVNGLRVSVTERLIVADPSALGQPYNFQGGLPFDKNTGALIRQVDAVTSPDDSFVAGVRVGELGGVYMGAGSDEFTPYSLFTEGQEGVLYCPFDIANNYQDVDGTVPATAAGQAIRCVFDTHAGPGTRGSIATNRAEPDAVPFLEGSAGQYRLPLDTYDFTAFLYTEIDADNWTGFCTIASEWGTYSFEFFFEDGFGENPFILYNNLPNLLVGCLLRKGPYTPADIANTEAWFVSQGAGAAGVNAFSGIENFDYQFVYLSHLVGEFPTIDTSAGTSFVGAWSYVIGMTTFPLLDFSSAEDLEEAWFGCEKLASFPAINVSACTNFASAWRECPALTSFPALDTSAGTNFAYAWASCLSLTDFPALDVSAGTNFNNTWSNCLSLTDFPILDVSAGTNFAYAWAGCLSLTDFPILDVSAGEDFDNTWSECTALTSFPALDVSAGTNFNNTWSNCTALTSFPALDTSAGTNFDNTWSNCTALTSFPALDFASAGSLFFTWLSCTNLADFPANVFDTCPCTNFEGAFQNTGLTEQSVDNILVSINAAGTSNGRLDIFGGTSAAPGTAGLAAKAALESRGWTVNTNVAFAFSNGFSSGFGA